VPRLQLIRAHITGRLQLHYAAVLILFSLLDCRFDEPVELADASLRAADFTGCPSSQPPNARRMANTNGPELLPQRWAIILLAGLMAGALVLTMAGLLPGLGAAGATILGLHQLMA
jgi:hypothetical protein